jgi:hypothetical protein
MLENERMRPIMPQVQRTEINTVKVYTHLIATCTGEKIEVINLKWFHA